QQARADVDHLVVDAPLGDGGRAQLGGEDLAAVAGHIVTVVDDPAAGDGQPYLAVQAHHRDVRVGSRLQVPLGREAEELSGDPAGFVDQLAHGQRPEVHQRHAAAQDDVAPRAPVRSDGVDHEVTRAVPAQ